MCNLYRLHKPADEFASFFGAILNDVRATPGNAAEEVYPGYPGVAPFCRGAPDPGATRWFAKR